MEVQLFSLAQSISIRLEKYPWDCHSFRDFLYICNVKAEYAKKMCEKLKEQKEKETYITSKEKADKEQRERQFDLGKFTVFADCLGCGTQRCSPAEPEWREGCQKYKDFISLHVTDKYVAFWGGPFSNFYPCKIVIDQDWWGNQIEPITFKSSEQCFMWYKATYFGDEETADEILKATSPKEAKALGRQVKGFDNEEWVKARDVAMYNAVYAKFSQNENLKKYITNPIFDDKMFVEGSPFDEIYGVGIHWDDPKIDDESNWKGLNLLGTLLTDVKVMLKNNQEEDIPW